MESLVISNLYKSYGKNIALKNVSLTIKKGIFGLLGPNGAGKTTLMKCILSLLKDYTGEIGYNNISLKKYHSLDILIGYLPQNFSIYKQLNIYEVMEHISILKELGRNKSNINEILEKVNLIDEKSKKVKNLSGGMLRRLGIAQALLGDPEILIIDEPTAGLDPNERIRFRNILNKISKNSIIIVSTHIVEDLEIIADEVGILSNGNLILNGSLQNVIKSVENKVAIKTIHQNDLEEYESQFKVTSLKQKDEKIQLRIVGDILPENSQLQTPTLEDVYFYNVGGEK